MFFVAAGVIVLLSLFWIFRPSRRDRAAFPFVYVNQDRSVRELSPEEQAFLSAKYSGGDGGRPYVKSRFGSSDGWGSKSGFIERRRVPARVAIKPVHPNYDALVKQLGHDKLGHLRAAGDVISTGEDGSITCTPNKNLSRKERFELARAFQWEDQRRREALAKV